MRKITSALIGLSLSAVGSAADNAVLEHIRATLAARFPKAQITDVRSAAMPGLYEVLNAGEIAYTDAHGDYLLMGQLLETKTQRNLTRARWEEINAIDFKSLPLDLAIKTVRGTGARKLAVFADPDCPYCQQLETQLAGISDITIYTFLFPLAELHPDAPAKAQQLWCAPDRAAAWSSWMLKREMVVETKDCKDGPLAAIAELGTKLRIDSTPTSFTANGQRISGALKREQLESLLAAAMPPTVIAPVAMTAQ